MNSIDGLLRLADNEFQAIIQNGKFRSREEIDSVYKLVDIVKDIHCIWAYEEEEDSGFSEDGGSYESGAYRSYRSNRGSYDGSYEGGMSGARGRGRNARRDSMGRYSREDGMSGEMSGRNGRSRRSYRGGYSREDGKQEFVEELRSMMEEAPDDQTRQKIQKMISEMEQN